MPRRALLAIRSDIAPSVESEYLDWLTKEHTIERVSIEGFVSARIYKADRSDINRYWIFYDLESVAVVNSSAYVNRLNNPTSWSAKMMPHLGNFVRGGGEVVGGFGLGYGAKLLPIIDFEVLAGMSDGLESIAATSHVTSIQLLQTDPRRTSVPTNEKTLRSGDRIFNSMLLITALDAPALNNALRHPKLSHLERVNSEIGEKCFYSLVFCLSRPDLKSMGAEAV